MIPKHFYLQGILRLFIGVAMGLIFSTHLFAGKIEHVEILKEQKEVFSIHQIVKDSSLIYKPFKPGNFERKPESFWLRFNYHNDDPVGSGLAFLSAPFIIYKKLDLYYLVGDSLHHYTSGASLKFEDRNLPFPDLYLKLPDGRNTTMCWLHVDGFFGFNFYFTEKKIDTIIDEEITLATFDFSIIGMSFLASFLSFLFFLVLKDKLYLYYALFSAALIVSRLTQNGYIVEYVASFLPFNSLKPIFVLFAISYGLASLSLLFYFYEFLKLYKRSRMYKQLFIGLATIRLIFLLINVFTDAIIWEKIFNSRILDLIIQSILLLVVFKTSKKYIKQLILPGTSLFFLLIGNLLFLLTSWGFITLEGPSYSFFLNLAAAEVIVFAVTTAYRTYFLKKEHDIAVAKTVEDLKERELLKDSLNKELEIKVDERTKEIQERNRQIEERNQQIEKMNQLLKSHNIELKSEVVLAQEARALQKIMDFSEFKKIFPDDDSCLKYLAKLKWRPNEVYKCRKCSYQVSPDASGLFIRCGRCRYKESVTSGTLFQSLKFPILKAFYITYRTSTAQNEAFTIADLAVEIELRQATTWTFKQKVMDLIQANKTKKKHRDGWTHLIEYSIEREKLEK